MLNIYVYAAEPELANKAVQQLRVTGADQVEVLPELQIPARPPKDNRYLFICETPAEKLADLMPQVLEEAAYATELSTWYEAQLKILDVYTTHKKRSILITTRQLQINSEALLEHINAQWQLVLTQAGRQAHNNGKETDSLLGYIVQNLIEKTPPLYHLAASQSQATGCTEQIYSEPEAIDSYRKLKAAKSAFKHQIDDAQKRLTDFQNLQDESELLLLQLHQVQEELENHFLKYKEAEQELEKAQNRYREILKRHPEDINYASVQFQAVGDDTFSWVVTDLESALVSRAEVRFETFIESGTLGVRFKKDDENAQLGTSLIRWPHVAKNLLEVECIPAGKGEVKALRAGTLRNLGSADWALLKLVPRIVKQAFTEKTPPDNIHDSKHMKAVDRLLAALPRVPPTLRFDSIALKNHLVNQDYEHLWFVFHGMSLGERHWPKFEIRLGASNIKPHKFTEHPKIEIPLIDSTTKPFESWFDESVDGYGPKWELRFDLKKNIADTAIWSQLNQQDQQAVLGALNQLIELDENIFSQSQKIDRSWEIWRAVFKECGRLLKKQIR